MSQIKECMAELVKEISATTPSDKQQFELCLTAAERKINGLAFRRDDPSAAQIAALLASSDVVSGALLNNEDCGAFDSIIERARQSYLNKTRMPVKATNFIAELKGLQ